MTVCIAQILTWKYGDNDLGRAILTASDREITAGDVEYEPLQQKICFLTPHALLLIAGDFSLHSEAIQRTQRQILSDGQTDPQQIAEMYAMALREIKLRQAVNFHLAPLGLTLDAFHARQREFSSEFVDRLTGQLQQYQGAEAEALIAGIDRNFAHLYTVDSACQVTCHNDVGFAAIGIGAWHAKAAFMQARYTTGIFYAPAFALLYLAKKRAEIAPGVGKATDYHLITRLGWSPVGEQLVNKANEVYADYEKKQEVWFREAIDQLNESLCMPPLPPENQLTTPTSEAPPSSSSAPSSKDQT